MGDQRIALYAVSSPDIPQFIQHLTDFPFFFRIKARVNRNLDNRDVRLHSKHLSEWDKDTMIKPGRSFPQAVYTTGL